MQEVSVGAGEEDLDEPVGHGRRLLQDGVQLGLHVAHAVELVESVPLDELLAELDPPNRVVEPVERGRPQRDTHHVGDDQHGGPADGRHGREAAL